jgi:predicted SAM-dependent methyltransferase
MRLELGSGGRPAPGYTHLDIRPLPGVEIVDDATTLAKVKDRSCEAIRAAHLLEHFSWRETHAVLLIWRSKLEDGGLLEIEVPSLMGHVVQWRSGIASDARFVEMLYGEQDYPENCHRTAFTSGSLHAALSRAHFREPVVKDIGLVLLASARR